MKSNYMITAGDIVICKIRCLIWPESLGFDNYHSFLCPKTKRRLFTSFCSRLPHNSPCGVKRDVKSQRPNVKFY